MRVLFFRPTREFFTHMVESPLPHLREPSVWFARSHRIGHLAREDAITCEGLQILTYALHPWSLRIKGFLACHTYCETGHSFIRSSPRTTDTRFYCRAFGSGSLTTCFYDGGLSRLGFEHNLPLAGRKL